MFGHPTSIRRKIRRSFWAVFLFINLISAAILLNLLLIEERVASYRILSTFLDQTLEIRRYEKNYFLYRNRQDYDETVRMIAAAEDLIGRHRKEFDGVDNLRMWALLLFRRREIPEVLRSRASVEVLALLDAYRRRLNEDFGRGGMGGPLEAEIRSIGRQLTEIAEQMAGQEQERIRRLLGMSRRMLLGGLILLFIGTALLGRLLSRMALRPLTRLEESMQEIASGRLEMLSAPSRDTEIVALIQAFNRMIRELFKHRDVIRAEKLASLGTMFAGIAHEINNPLSNISSSAEILLEEADKADAALRRELAEQIVQETERATRIVRSVLSFSRDRGSPREEVSLAELFRETFRFIRWEMPPHITFSVEIPPRIRLHGNRNRLEQAFLNLLKNAVDAMPDKGREERLMVEARQRGPVVEIRISDTGRGIPEHQQEKIFDPFFTTKEVGKGTGLGLFVTHEIIEEHGGTVTVQSREGEGTTFVVTLPAEGERA